MGALLVAETLGEAIADAVEGVDDLAEAGGVATAIGVLRHGERVEALAGFSERGVGRKPQALEGIRLIGASHERVHTPPPFAKLAIAIF